MPSPGRPTLLDAQLKNTLCLMLRAGCTRRQAAELVGIDESTIRKAAQRDGQFARALKKATAEQGLDCLKKLRRSSRHSWRAAAWFLERVCPETFGPPRRRIVGRRKKPRLAKSSSTSQS